MATNKKNLFEFQKNIWKNKIKTFAHTWFSIYDVKHACKNHMMLKDNELIARNKPLASTFIISEDMLPMNSLLQFILTVIEDESAADEISTWMADLDDHSQWCLYISSLPEGMKGRVYIRDEKKFDECDGVIVILKKFAGGSKFYIATVFPFADGYEPEIEDGNSF